MNKRSAYDLALPANAAIWGAGLSEAGNGVLWGGLAVDLLASALLLQGALFGTRIVYREFKR